MNHCPIPTCKRPIAQSKFMCGEHRRMIPPLIRDAIAHAKLTCARTDLSPVDLKVARQTYRQSLALGFAEVCDALGMDMEKMLRSEPLPLELAPMRRAILKILSTP